MTSSISLSGLNAAQADLRTTSNNIANANTYGFHASRTEFADLFTRSAFSASGTESGSGVRVHTVRQSFSQGPVNQTSNTLDLALQGQGFFAVSDAVTDGNLTYTRAGAFGVDAEGYIVNASGGYLQGYPTNADGSIATSLELQQMRIPSTVGDPQATTAVDLSVNLPFGAEGVGNQDAVPPTNAFDPADDTSYAFSADVNVWNNDGEAMPAKVFFIQVQEPTAGDPSTTYEMRMEVDGEVLTTTPATAAQINFDEYGTPTSTIAPMDFSSTSWNLSLDLTDTEMSDDTYQVLSSAHDGERPRGLSGLEVGDDGVVWASYAGNQAISLGQLAIANFPNSQGLKQLGESSYAQTVESGDALMGQAGSDGFGKVDSGALEMSNVDLTSELVNLITAQRNYQASAKALETSNSVTQTIMNIRG
ncbi:flagellar hook protein FlgE [Thalassovita mangrovi]|uniref:Flagellar hook protein FlgE n=1 Tax=Thalassovita mangrovi TaxID=2692236 RepID=A0A6L8LH85_9RHOB|nr:flagellar hook protein FlgE [Thalassovita mangrovi]MYM53720.1 flagellar hook-basal body complex protein [Thalassovita mangrovi]